MRFRCPISISHARARFATALLLIASLTVFSPRLARGQVEILRERLIVEPSERRIAPETEERVEALSLDYDRPRLADQTPLALLSPTAVTIHDGHEVIPLTQELSSPHPRVVIRTAVVNGMPHVTFRNIGSVPLDVKIAGHIVFGAKAEEPTSDVQTAAWAKRLASSPSSSRQDRQIHIWAPEILQTQQQLVQLLGLPKPAESHPNLEAVKAIAARIQSDLRPRADILISRMQSAGLADVAAGPGTGFHYRRFFQDSELLRAVDENRETKDAVRAGSDWLVRRGLFVEFWRKAAGSATIERHTGPDALRLAREAHETQLSALSLRSHNVFVTSRPAKVIFNASEPMVIAAGQPASPISQLESLCPAKCKVIVVEDPLERLYQADGQPASWADIQKQAQSACPTCRLYLGTPTASTMGNADRIPLQVSARNIRVHVPDATDPFVISGSFLVSSLQELEDLSKSHPGRATTVVAVSGHRGAELSGYLDSLGAKNAFRGQVVLLFSCFTATSTAENSRLIRDYGARAVLTFPTEIDPDAVQRTVAAMTAILKESDGSVDLYDLPRAAVQRALDSIQIPSMDAPTEATFRARKAIANLLALQPATLQVSLVLTHDHRRVAQEKAS
jgi:hypothetical protein